MKQLITIVLFVSIVALPLLAQPELEIVEPKFEFGYLPQHCTVSHYFWFKSVGDDTLVINDINTGCVCALVNLDKNRLAPGDSTLVGISWEIKNSLYNAARHPKISTNARPKPYYLELKGVILKSMDSLSPLSSSPYKLELTRYKEKSINEIEFELKNIADKEIEIFEMSYPIEECEITLPAKIPANSSAKGFIKVKPEYLDKEFMRSLTIAVAGFYKKRITIPIRRKFY
ncbi:DUF1573 domain-containing protein [Candidatus Zixiibacteriota bacterium]